MKNFQSANLYRANRIGRFRRIIGVAILFAIIFFALIVYQDSLGSFFRFFGVGMWQIRTETSSMVGETTNAVFRSKESIMLENNELREERNLFATLALENKFLKEENALLKEHLGRKEYSSSRVIATILSRPPESPYDTLVLDAGSVDGVKSGDVVALGSIVLGKIVSVDSRSALAVLFSSSSEQLSALIASSTVQSTVYGRGGGNFYMRLPADIKVNEGDLITLPSIYPKILGSVARVEEASADSFKFVFFRSPVNIEQLRWVDILTSQ